MIYRSECDYKPRDLDLPERTWQREIEEWLAAASVVMLVFIVPAVLMPIGVAASVAIHLLTGGY